MSEVEAGGSSSDAAAPADSPSILEALDEDAMVEVMLAAKAVGALAHLATSSKQVCSTTRARVPVHLQVRDKEQADIVIKSQTRSGRSFSGCTQLTLVAADMTSSCLAVGVMGAAQQWPALQQLQLTLPPGKRQWEEYEQLQGVDPDTFTSSVLFTAPSLRNLRQLELSVPAFGTCSAGVVGQMVQLTKLQLSVTAMPVDTPADLLALSSLSSLREFKADVAPATHPAAGPAGPWCLPSSLTRLELATDDEEDSPYIMAYWLTHLPACPQLQCLHLYHGVWPHASAHPAALVPRLAQHNPRLRELRLDSAIDAYTEWLAEAPGLPPAAVPEAGGWHPSAALAGLTGLVDMRTDPWLYVETQEDWQHLSHLSCLSELVCPQIICAPDLSTATLPRLLRLCDCDVHLGGYDIGLLLLACPLLEEAEIQVWDPVSNVPWQRARVHTQPGYIELHPHPSLQRLSLVGPRSWDDATQAAQYAALAPVLSNVPHVWLYGWYIGEGAAAAAGGGTYHHLSYGIVVPQAAG